ncbi:hypothetical protein [Vibrio diazotrophicus]|uniref:Uncharacterized protein n=1 Tax=Vibrio diazotrophicus TaxID=685 RepID=A0ABX4W7X4_VIBDI|nr:hypothetical protein [Vibrio diazotrophicus]PNH95589.1 hypothetical protein C1O24_13895 [Vibrio diazotrophicus]PNH99851.1 hypothetical protein C1O25_14600 [Vibrio diazotrophicus]
MTNLAIKYLLNDINHKECDCFFELISNLAYQSILVIGYLECKPGYLNNTWDLYYELSNDKGKIKYYTELLSRFITEGQKCEHQNHEYIINDFFKKWDIEVKSLKISDSTIFFTIMVLSLLCFNIGFMSKNDNKINTSKLIKLVRSLLFSRSSRITKQYFHHNGNFNNSMFDFFFDDIDIESISNIYDNSMKRGSSVEYSLLCVLISIFRTNKRYTELFDKSTIEKLDSIGYLSEIKNNLKTQAKIEEALTDIESRFNDELDTKEYVILLTITWFFHQIDNINLH